MQSIRQTADGWLYTIVFSTVKYFYLILHQQLPAHSHQSSTEWSRLTQGHARGPEQQRLLWIQTAPGATWNSLAGDTLFTRLLNRLDFAHI